MGELEPEEIYAPQADTHADHRALSEAARSLLGDLTARLYEYPVRYWGRVPWLVTPRGRFRAVAQLAAGPIHEWRRAPALLVRTEGFHERKLAALGVYAGEMEAVGSFVFPYADAGYEVFFPVTGER